MTSVQCVMCSNCSAIPGRLPSKFTTVEMPYGADYVIYVF